MEKIISIAFFKRMPIKNAIGDCPVCLRNRTENWLMPRQAIAAISSRGGSVRLFPFQFPLNKHGGTVPKVVSGFFQVDGGTVYGRVL